MFLTNRRNKFSIKPWINVYTNLRDLQFRSESWAKAYPCTHGFQRFGPELFISESSRLSPAESNVPRIKSQNRPRLPKEPFQSGPDTDAGLTDTRRSHQVGAQVGIGAKPIREWMTESLHQHTRPPEVTSVGSGFYGLTKDNLAKSKKIEEKNYKARVGFRRSSKRIGSQLQISVGHAIPNEVVHLGLLSSRTSYLRGSGRKISSKHLEPKI